MSPRQPWLCLTPRLHVGQGAAGALRSSNTAPDSRWLRVTSSDKIGCPGDSREPQVTAQPAEVPSPGPLLARPGSWAWVPASAHPEHRGAGGKAHSLSSGSVHSGNGSRCWGMQGRRSLHEWNVITFPESREGFRWCAQRKFPQFRVYF